MPDNPFEIPQYLREVSEQNLKQADAAYKQLMDFVSKAKDAWTEAMPENAMSAGFKDVQNRAMDIVMENAKSTLETRRQDQQREDFSRHFNASDPVCSRSDAGLRHADATAIQLDRRSSPEIEKRRDGRRRERDTLQSNDPGLQRPSFRGRARPRRRHSEAECRLGFRAGRKNGQGRKYPGAFDT